jgi:signal transduction histidine kinase
MQRLRPIALPAVCFVLLGLLWSTACAQGTSQEPEVAPIALPEGTDRVPANGHIEMLRDPKGTLTIADVLQSPAGFTPVGAATPNLGLTDDTVWLRFRVANPSAQAAEYLVQLAAPGQEDVDFYAPNGPDGALTAIASGTARPFTARPVPSASFVFPAQVPAQAETTYYLRVQSHNAPLRLPLAVWRPAAFAASDRQLEFVWGALIGALLLAAAYHLLLYLGLRDRNYLLLGLFAFAVALLELRNTGFALQSFWPDRPTIVWQMVPVLIALTLLTLLAFADSFLELAARLPIAHRIAVVGMIYFTAGLVFVPLGRPAITYALIIGGAIAVSLGAPVAAALVWRQGFRPARYFLLALALPFLITVAVDLARVGLGDWQEWYEVVPSVTIIFFILCSSFALADRVNELRREMARAARRLGKYLDAIPVGVAVYDANQRSVYVNRATSDLVVREGRLAVSYEEARGRVPAYVAGTDRLYPVDKLPFNLAYQGIPAHADDIELEAFGDRVAVEGWSHPLLDEDGKVEGIVSTFLDIRARRAVEAELAAYREHLETLVERRTQAERRQREVAEALQDTAAALAGTLDQGAVLTTIMGELRRVIPCDGALLALIEDERLVAVGADGRYHALLGQGVPLPQGILLFPAIQDAQAHMLRSLAAEPGDCVNGSGSARCTMNAPLISDDDVLGMITVANGEGANFAPDEVRLLRAFADQAATAVTNARLHREAQVAAAEEERGRLARELHDAVTQTIYSARLVADTAAGLWTDAPPAARGALDDVRWMLASALAEMRMLLLELRPAAIGAARLDTLLAQLGEAFRGRTHIPVTFTANDAHVCNPPEDARLAIYRIGQEAFTNIARHAQAGHVRAQLVCSPGYACVMITDDGCGFDPRR